MRLRATFIALSLASLFACKSDEPADESSSSSETAGDGDGDPSGDGDGDGNPGDGDGASGDGDGGPGDGDGDGDGDECPPPDPPLALTLDGSWTELPAPSLGFACNLAEGDGPTWGEGVTVIDGGSVDHLDIGSDGKLYAAGAAADGAMLAGIALGGMGPNGGELWARAWTYDGDSWPARGLAATASGKIWLTAAPEHLLAASEAGDLVDGPFEAYTPGMRYVGTIQAGDDNLLVTAVERGAPPTCVERVRLENRDDETGQFFAVSPAIVTTRVMGIDGDGSGGAWMTVLDLNGAGVTSNHYADNGDMLGSFGATNQAANVMAADMAVAQDGDVVIAMRSLGFIEVHRYADDGTQVFATMLPAFGAQHGEPHVAIDGQDAAIVGVTVNSSFMLARVLDDGSIDYAGRWSCGDAVEVHDVAAGSNGVWVGGVQGPLGWVGNF